MMSREICPLVQSMKRLRDLDIEIQDYHTSLDFKKLKFNEGSLVKDYKKTINKDGFFILIKL